MADPAAISLIQLANDAGTYEFDKSTLYAAQSGKLKEVIRIFDTTLRDGEQSPGATMTTEEKIQVAHQLIRLNVDIIEAGFPAASPGDLLAVREIARTTRGHDVAIAGLARASVSDIDAAWEAVCDAERPVIHVFLATSDIHLKHKFNNDLGMATANTLAAIKAGARQVEVTINGLGERAGNTAMEEVVMALRTRPDYYGNVTTRINNQEFLATSQMVSRLTGIPVQPNKAIVGENAFAHEAEIQQDGMLKNPLTYEIMTPQSVGWSNRKLVMGKHSGRHGLDARLRQLGHKLDADQLRVAYSRFIALANEKKHITDADLLYIVR